MLKYIILSFILLSCKQITYEDISVQISNKNIENLESNLEKGNIDYTTQESEDLLSQAITSDFDEAVELLLKKGINPNIKINNIELAEYLLSQKNGKYLILLLENGYNSNLKINDTESLLFWVILNDHYELIEPLIHYGADINFIKPITKIPVFDLAIRLVPESYQKYFITERLDTTVINHKGITYFEESIIMGSYETAKLLINTNNVIEEVNGKYFWVNVIRYWKEGSVDFAESIITKGYNLDTSLPLYQEAIKDLNIEAVKWLISKNISPYNEYKEEPMWYGYNAFDEIDFTRKKLRSIEIPNNYSEDKIILDEIEDILYKNQEITSKQ